MLTVTKRVERARSIVIIKHKYMLMCNHKIHINIVSCLRNSNVRREIGQLKTGRTQELMMTVHRSLFELLNINIYDS